MLTSNAEISRFDVDHDPDTALFTNAGVLRKTGTVSTESSNVAVRLVSDAPGRIEVAGGKLTVNREAFFGGPISVAAGAFFISQAPESFLHTFRGEVRISGAGEAFLVGGAKNRHRVEGALINEIGDAADKPGRVLLNNVDIELAPDGSLDNEGRLEWGDPAIRAPSGAIHGAGFLYNGTAALLSIMNPASLAANFVNNGTVRQTANLKVGNTTAPLENNDDALWELRSGGILSAPMTTPQGIDNRGHIEVAVDVLDARVEPPLDIDGSGIVKIAAGSVLTLTGGGRWKSSVPVALDGELWLSAPQTVARTYVVEQESTLTPLNDGGKVSVLSRATLRVNGRLTTTYGPGTLHTPAVFVDSGAITGPGTFDNGGEVEVKRGRLGDPAGASLMLLNHGSVTVRESDNTLTGMLINDIDPDLMVPLSRGVIATNGSKLTVPAGSAIDSRRGVVTLQGTAELLGDGTLYNAGTLHKVLGGTSPIALHVDTPGTVLVDEGRLSLNGTVAQVQGNTLTSGGWRVAAGASLTIAGAQITTIGAGASVIVAGEQLTGSAFKNVRYVFGSLGVSTVFEAPSMTVGGGGRVATGTGDGNGPRVVQRLASGVGGPSPVAPETRFALAGGPFLNQGSVEPGGIGAVGPFGIDGGYTQEAGAVLHLDIGATVHDQLVVSGPVALAGTLAVDFVGGYVPQPTDVIVAVTGSAVNGTFANAAQRLFTSAGAFEVTYSPTSVVLSNFDPDAVAPTPTPTATPAPQSPSPAATPSPNGTGAATDTPTPTATPIACVGDCDGDGAVSIAELITGVNVALGTLGTDRCSAFDANGDAAVSINELIAAVNNALGGCALA